MGKQTEFGYGWNIAEEPYPHETPTPEEVMQDAEPLSYEKLGELCKFVTDSIKATTQHIKETYTVLPQPNSGKGNQSSKKGAGNSKASGPAFLKVENLTKDPRTAKILGVRVADENDRYNDVVMKVSLEGTAYFVGMRTSYDIYQQLTNAFGTDPDEWVDKKVKFYAKWDGFKERNLTAIEIPSQDEDEAPARKKRS